MKISKIEMILGVILIGIGAYYFGFSSESFEEECKSGGGIPVPINGEYCSFVTEAECEVSNGKWLGSGLCKNPDGTYLLMKGTLNINEL
jgi:hypothetical protein